MNKINILIFRYPKTRLGRCVTNHPCLRETRGVKHLAEGCLEGGTGAHATAATGGSTLVVTIVGTRLGAVVAVDQDVVKGADVAAGALEDTGVHVGDTARADDAQRVAAHVDLARDVDHAPLAKGEFSPGVGCLAVDQLGVGVDGAPGTRGTVGEGDPDGLTGGDGGGDMGLDDVDPGAGDAPDDEDQVFARVVAELVLVSTVASEPDRAVVALRVDTGGQNSHGGESADISGSDGCGTFSMVSGVSGTVLGVTFKTGDTYSTWT